jgi:hypothetical protein
MLAVGTLPLTLTRPDATILLGILPVWFLNLTRTLLQLAPFIRSVGAPGHEFGALRHC